jgi:hypothetical protein
MKSELYFGSSYQMVPHGFANFEIGDIS